MAEQAVQGSEQGATAQAGSSHAPRDSFWKSLPGILTAGGSFLMALTGLMTLLHQNGYLGTNSEAAPQAQASAAAISSPSVVSPAGPSTSPAALTASPLVQFRVGQMSDGFAMVRSRPTTASDGLVKLPSGTPVQCGEALRDVDRGNARRWRFCPEYDGYISTRLLGQAGG